MSGSNWLRYTLVGGLEVVDGKMRPEVSSWANMEKVDVCRWSQGITSYSILAQDGYLPGRHHLVYANQCDMEFDLQPHPRDKITIPCNGHTRQDLTLGRSCGAVRLSYFFPRQECRDKQHFAGARARWGPRDCVTLKPSRDGHAAGNDGKIIAGRHPHESSDRSSWSPKAVEASHRWMDMRMTITLLRDATGIRWGFVWP